MVINRNRLGTTAIFVKCEPSHLENLENALSRILFKILWFCGKENTHVTSIIINICDGITMFLKEVLRMFFDDLVRTLVSEFRPKLSG